MSNVCTALTQHGTVAPRWQAAAHAQPEYLDRPGWMARHVLLGVSRLRYSPAGSDFLESTNAEEGGPAGCRSHHIAQPGWLFVCYQVRDFARRSSKSDVWYFSDTRWMPVPHGMEARTRMQNLRSLTHLLVCPKTKQGLRALPTAGAEALLGLQSGISGIGDPNACNSRTDSPISP